MQRYFATGLENGKLILKQEDLYHLFNVLRLKRGEHFQVVFEDNLFDCEVINPKLVDFQYIFSRKLVDFQYIFSIFISNPKGDKLELMLQKCTEIGVTDFYLLQTERSIAKIDLETFNKRVERYKKIIQEAAQQSKQDKIPEIHFVEKLDDLKQIELDKKFIAYENEKADSIEKFNSLKECKSFGFLIGPEGGFSEKEVAYFNSIGFENISLGKSILRCETAPIYIASVVSFIKGTK